VEFYGLTAGDLPKEMVPSLVLSVETEELFINAGLQDRVIQVRGWPDGWVGGAYG
jgi:glucuronokinase